MAYQERFDELAKGLATDKFSRGQVLKGLAASLLLTGPLGALARPVLGQTGGCDSAAISSCLESAKRAYASCKRRCRRLSSSKKRKKCLQGCNKTFIDQNMACSGCVSLDFNNATKTTTPRACKDPCAVQALSNQANQNAAYSKLAIYLTGEEGFAADGDPKALVLSEDGALLRSVLGASYSHPSRTGETAQLYYVVQADGTTGANAAVFKDGTLLYALVVGDDEQVEKGFPPEQQTTSASEVASRSNTEMTNTSSGEGTSTSSTSSRTGALAIEASAIPGFDCENGCQFLCDPAVGAITCGLILGAACGSLTAGFGAAVCIVGLGAPCAAGAHIACVSLCNQFCACEANQHRCGDVCCGACQDCLNGQCVAKQCGQCEECDPNTNACKSTCASNETCEGGQCRCPSGQTKCGDQCVDTQTDANNCGSCGNACATGETCEGGQCKQCSEGQTKCDDQCVDLKTDPKHCGSCDKDCTARDGPYARCITYPGSPPSCYCGGGAGGMVQCNTSPTTSECCDWRRYSYCIGAYGGCGYCSPELRACYNFTSQSYECKDLQNDPENCGDCGDDCFKIWGLTQCSDGVCH